MIMTNRILIYFSLTFLFIFVHIVSRCQEYDSLKLTQKAAGYGYMYHGKKVSFSSVGRIIEKNEQARYYYYQSSTYRTAGNVALLVGGATFFVGSIIAVGLANENKQPNDVLTGVYIGLPIMALSIPFHFVAKHNIKKAINQYNQDLSNPVTMKVRAGIGITHSGVGLIISF